MNIKEMNNEQLMRYYLCAKREMKTLASTVKQYEDELNRRFDEQKLVGKEEEKWEKN